MILPLYFVLSFLLFNKHTIAQSASEKDGVQELHQFRNETSIDNILVLSNGSLLLTLLTEPSLYRFDPEKPSEKPVLVHRFPHRTSLRGVTQLNQTTVAIIAGNLTGSIYQKNAGVPGSFAVFLLDLSGRIVACFPIRKASLLNGLTALPGSSHLLLLSDPTLAVVWRLNTLTGAVDKAIADPLFVTSPDSSFPALGGIHVVGQYFYFAAANSGQLARIRINPDGTSSGEPPKTRNYGFIYYVFGDFAVTPDDYIWITDPIGKTVARVSPGGASQGVSLPLCGDELDHPTSVAFASNSVNESTLYIVTAGFLPGYGGTGGGQVLKADLQRLNSPCGEAGYVRRS